MLQPSPFYQPGDWSQTWASDSSKAGLICWVLLISSGKSSFWVLQSSTVSWLGWSPMLLIPQPALVHFRMGLLYFSRWKEREIHGFLNSLLLRWSQDFEPGRAGGDSYGSYGSYTAAMAAIRQLWQLYGSYGYGMLVGRDNSHVCFTAWEENQDFQWRFFPPIHCWCFHLKGPPVAKKLLLPSHCRAVARKSTTSSSPRPRKVTFCTAKASGACPDSDADRAFSANSFLGCRWGHPWSIGLNIPTYPLCIYTYIHIHSIHKNIHLHVDIYT